jgi:uncharacterized protein (TIGR04255 family)
MGEQIPDIQDNLRTTYEEFVEEQIPALQISGVGEAPVLRTESRWRFETSDRRHGYILQNTSLVYHTTAYLDFGEFVKEILQGFNLIASTAGIRRFNRVGLRYIDLIQADEETTLEELLHPLLQGFGRELTEVIPQFSQYIYGGQTKTGQLVFRATRGKHNFPLPPDLLPLTLRVARAADAGQTSVFLDTDHFVDLTETPVDVEKLEETVRALKAPITQAFKHAITDKAINAWK